MESEELKEFISEINNIKGKDQQYLKLILNNIKLNKINEI